ncbi:MAG: alpha/beta hydrolase [bacterium]
MGLLSYFQEKLIFKPEKLPANHLYKFEIPFEEKFFITEEDVSLNALFFKATESKGVIFYNHGTVGNLDNWGLAAVPFVELGYDFFIYDYRTYGKSRGKISQRALYSDAMFIYNELKKEFEEDKITVIGRSIGTGIASYIASQNNPKQLILESPFYSMIDIVKHYYPVMPSFLIPYNFRTDLHLQKVKCPVYLIHGTDDELVYYGSSLKLKKLLGDKAELITIEGGGHDHLGSFDFYRDKMREILK